MTTRMQDLATEIVRLQGELDREIEVRRKALGWELKARIGRFETGVMIEQRKLKKDLGTFLSRSSLLTVLTAPVIYAMLIPLALLDASVSLYQAICFRVYRIDRVKRSDFLAWDRERLAYLNIIEAVNCAYCSYGNGVIAYAREIVSRTEQYWCPIKHALRIPDPHQRYYDFLEYGDADGYRKRLGEFRDALREVPATPKP
jgi:hypothetical protein